MTGLPGTGKSTIAEALGRRIGSPVFAGDWLLGAMKPSGVLSTVDSSTVIDLSDRLLWTLVQRQLTLEQSAIVDTLINDEVVGAWAAGVAEFGARFRVVECVCADEGVHRERVEGRRRNIPGWHEIDWDHVERMRDEFPTPGVPHLTIDALNSVDENLVEVLAYIYGRG
ncbi:MAG: ATP-binding protein [Acidimicrobiales bacterium]